MSSLLGRAAFSIAELESVAMSVAPIVAAASEM